METPLKLNIAVQKRFKGDMYSCFIQNIKNWIVRGKNVEGTVIFCGDK